VIFIAYHNNSSNKIYSEDGKCHYNKAKEIAVHNITNLGT